MAASVRNGMYTLSGNRSNTVTVKATFVQNTLKDRTFSLTKYAAEGLEFTFVKDETTLKGTVTSGAFTFLEMEAGEWSVTLQTMGMTLNLGNLLIDPDQTEISLDAAIAKVFPNLSSEYTGQIDLANGAFEYLGADKPNMMMNVGGISQGDAYFAAKISMTQEDLDKVLGQGGEIQFSIALTVNGATRETGFWLSGRESKAGLRTDFNWDEGGVIANFADGTYTLTEYGNMLIGDGLWLVVKYNASTGYLENLIGAALDNMKYVRSWNAMALEKKGDRFSGRRQDYSGNSRGQ